jgi:hypothetical protein
MVGTGLLAISAVAGEVLITFLSTQLAAARTATSKLDQKGAALLSFATTLIAATLI